MRTSLVVVMMASSFMLQVVVVAEPPPPPRTKLLRIAHSAKVEILDPARTTSGGDVHVLGLMYEGLTRPSLTLPTTYEPCLAESWEVSEDQCTWTFQLRPDVGFHDGGKFDAKAAKRSLDRSRNPEDKAAPAQLPYADELFGTVDSIEAVGELELKVQLRRPDYRLLVSLGYSAAAIVSPEAIAKMEAIKSKQERSTWLTQHTAGTGPYRAEGKVEYGAKFTLKAFDDYWGGRPTTETIQFETVLDAKERSTRLAAGSVDFIDNVPPAERAALEKNADVTLNVRKDDNLCYLAMNCSETAGRPTRDVKLRKAIALAIRRQQILDLMHGAAAAQFTLLPEIVEGHPAGYMPKGDELSDDEALKQAKALIEEVGVPKEPLKLLLPSIPRPYLAEPTLIAELIRKQLESVGLAVSGIALRMVELADSAREEDYDLMLLGWMGGGGGADVFYDPLLNGDGAPSDNNFARFYHADVAAKISAVRNEPSYQKRVSAYQDLEKTVFDEHRPLVPLFSTTVSDAWRADWAGIQIDSTGGWRLHVAGKK